MVPKIIQIGKVIETKFQNSAKKQKITKTIIGIDPGLQNFGIGIIYLNKNEIEKAIVKKKIIYDIKERIKNISNYSLILIKLKQTALIEEKLAFIYDYLINLIETVKPDLIVVEDVFVGLNKNSGLKLGIIRGCILTAIGKTKSCFETISPKQIKMEITKRGDAEKEDIQNIFKENLKNWPDEVKFDSSDALAAAICGIR